MNDGTRQSRSPMLVVLTALLAANLGLLWVQGAQLNRQHESLRQLHTDLQDLTDALDAYANSGDDSGDDAAPEGDGAQWAPAARHHRIHPRRGRLLRASLQEPPSSSPAPAPAEQDGLDQGRKDIEDANKSARDAIAKAREDQEKLSISENYRKGQEERKIQEAQYAWTRWVWLGLGVLILVFLGRAWVIKRGQ
ncbi:MAG TPA: hypothetical protein VFT46_10630 [Holophagaceae bacterium]|nr:hypothetical protein [Holophagaceae bacterium]